MQKELATDVISKFIASVQNELAPVKQKIHHMEETMQSDKNEMDELRAYIEERFAELEQDLFLSDECMVFEVSF